MVRRCCLDDGSSAFDTDSPRKVETMNSISCLYCIEVCSFLGRNGIETASPDGAWRLEERLQDRIGGVGVVLSDR